MQKLYPQTASQPKRDQSSQSTKQRKIMNIDIESANRSIATPGLASMQSESELFVRPNTTINTNSIKLNKARSMNDKTNFSKFRKASFGTPNSTIQNTVDSQSNTRNIFGSFKAYRHSNSALLRGNFIKSTPNIKKVSSQESQKALSIMGSTGVLNWPNYQSGAPTSNNSEIRDFMQYRKEHGSLFNSMATSPNSSSQVKRELQIIQDLNRQHVQSDYQIDQNRKKHTDLVNDRLVLISDFSSSRDIQQTRLQVGKFVISSPTDMHGSQVESKDTQIQTITQTDEKQSSGLYYKQSKAVYKRKQNLMQERASIEQQEKEQEEKRKLLEEFPDFQFIFYNKDVHKFFQQKTTPQVFGKLIDERPVTSQYKICQNFSCTHYYMPKQASELRQNILTNNRDLFTLKDDEQLFTGGLTTPQVPQTPKDPSQIHVSSPNSSKHISKHPSTHSKLYKSQKEIEMEKNQNETLNLSQLSKIDFGKFDREYINQIDYNYNLGQFDLNMQNREGTPFLSSTLSPQRLNDIVEMIAKCNENFIKVTKESDAFFEKFQKTDPDWLRGNDNCLSEDEIRYIRSEFTEKQPIERDIDSISERLERLLFFKKFMPVTRKMILKQAVYVQFPPGEIIFRQGDIGDYMYVILRGSVNVRIEKIVNQRKESQLVAVLYDGYQFGELAMMKTKSSTSVANAIYEAGPLNSLKEIQERLKFHEHLIEMEQIAQERGVYSMQKTQEQIKELQQQIKKDQYQKLLKQNADQAQLLSRGDQNQERNRRAATIEAGEYCDMLKINKDDFNEIMMGLMQDELDLKIQNIYDIHLFNNFQPFALIPLANLLKTERFGINDVIIKQDETFSQFYIVIKGRLRVVWAEQVYQDTSSSIFTKNMISHPINFKAGKLDQQVVDKKSQMTIQEQNRMELIAPIERQKTGDPDDDFPLRNKHHSNTIKLFDFETYDRDQDEKKQRIGFWKTHNYQKLCRGDFFGGRALYQLQPEQAKMSITFFIGALESQQEFDYMGGNQIIDSNKQWNKYKFRVSNESIQESAIQRGKPGFKEF